MPDKNYCEGCMGAAFNDCATCRHFTSERDTPFVFLEYWRATLELINGSKADVVIYQQERATLESIREQINDLIKSGQNAKFAGAKVAEIHGPYVDNFCDKEVHISREDYDGYYCIVVRTPKGEVLQFYIAAWREGTADEAHRRALHVCAQHPKYKDCTIIHIEQVLDKANLNIPVVQGY